jgi:putative DNA methylase
VKELPATAPGYAVQIDAQTQEITGGKVLSTDPPYYDNIGYADLSDYSYIWLRLSAGKIYPDIFSTITVPKKDELVASPYRHGGKENAEKFFLDGMSKVFVNVSHFMHPAFPITIYYAFKQAESENEIGVASTGWETFLEAVINSGLEISGTWPIRTEMSNRMIGSGTNALASSIVIVCRNIHADAVIGTRRDFINTLKLEMPSAIAHLQHSNIAPVDLAQSAIGPGMAVYTKFSTVIDAQGNRLNVRDALTLINQTLDEVLAEQEGDFDADSRWALAWFEQNGFKEGEYGVAETLSTAKNTSVNGLVEAGILESSKGKVRLLKPQELPEDWDPLKDKRLTEWEIVHHLIRVLEKGGESIAAEIVAKLGSKADIVKELAYRLYNICERKKRATEALSYNALIQSWQEIIKLAGERKKIQAEPGTLFDQEE